MSAIGKIERGRSHRVQCDGCGRISSDVNGYYFDKKLQRGGTISSKGRECQHDFCHACEAKNLDEKTCPKCRLNSGNPNYTPYQVEAEKK